MNRLDHRGTRRHLPARLPVTFGAAMGLVAGVAIYGAMTSATEALKPVAFAVAKASVAEAPARSANCAAGQKLERGFCVIHIVHKVVIPPPAASVAPARAPVTGAVAKGPKNPAGVARPGSAPEEPGSPAVVGSESANAVRGD
jgi:hypothetical protein